MKGTKEVPSVRDGGPYPRMVYINSSEDDIYCTDEYGRIYDGRTNLTINDEKILVIKRIVDGKDSESYAMLYRFDEDYLIKELAMVILKFGRKRIVFRKPNQKVYVKKNWFKDMIKNFNRKK